jgi:inosose dehydratase
VHAKDVDLALARRVRTGELTYTEAVAAGMYRPLGDGDIDFAAVAAALDEVRYDGWWVLEQDTILTGEPPLGEGPIVDVRRSADYLRGLNR